jgi:hypothetical protein
MTMPASVRHGHCVPPFGGEATTQANWYLKLESSRTLSTRNKMSNPPTTDYKILLTTVFTAYHPPPSPYTTSKSLTIDVLPNNKTDTIPKP